jgi:hypothetical protein
MLFYNVCMYTFTNCVHIEIIVIWGVAPCGLVDVYWRFVELRCLHLQDMKVSSYYSLHFPFTYRGLGSLYYNFGGFLLVSILFNYHLQFTFCSQDGSFKCSL